MIIILYYLDNIYMILDWFKKILIIIIFFFQILYILIIYIFDFDDTIKISFYIICIYIYKLYF